MRSFFTIASTVVTLCSLGCRPGRQAATQSRSCRPAAWTAPESLWAGPLTQVSAQPSSVSEAGDLILVVGRELAFPERPAPDTVFAGVVLKRGASRPNPVRRPPGARFFIDPIAAVDASGAPHVLWAEPVLTLADRGSPNSSRLRTVWSASLINGEWTHPIRVAMAADITWTESGQSPVVQAADGTLQFVVPASADKIGLLHLSLTPNGWIAGHIALPMPAAYSVLARQGSDLLLAYVSPVQGQRDINSLWFTRSTDDGRTWQRAVLVSRSGQTGAGAPMIVPIGGSVHLLWEQNLSGGLATEVLRHAESNDGGSSWGPRADLSLPGFLMTHGAAADSQGAVHVFFSAFVNGHLTLQRARWCASAWQAPDRVPIPGVGFGSGTVHRTPNGAVEVFASGETQSAGKSWTTTWVRTKSR